MTWFDIINSNIQLMAMNTAPSSYQPNLNFDNIYNLSNFDFNPINSLFTNPLKTQTSFFNSTINENNLNNISSYSKTTSKNAEELKSKWSKKYSRLRNYSISFFEKLIKLCDKLNCEPEDMLACMALESGFKSDAVNNSTNATGLIQFMPNVAKQFGTSVEELKNMSAEEQLDYVEKYFKYWINVKKFNGEKLSSGDIYAMIFCPSKANNEVYYHSNTKATKLNKGLSDANGNITKNSCETKLRQYYA